MTVRRSKRGQPALGDPIAHSKKAKGYKYEWIESLGDQAVEKEDVEDEDSLASREQDDLRKTHYGAFKRLNRSSKGKNPKSQPNTEQKSQIFRRGDTVLVAGVSKLPDVAVIIGLYGIESTGSHPETSSVDCKKAMLHWFHRPGNLASERFKRECGRNEIYYGVNQTVTVSLIQIIGHCEVSSDASALEESRLDPKSPSKRWDMIPLDAEEKFYTRAAYDSRTGIYYDLDWSSFRQRALKQADVSDNSDWIIRPPSENRERQTRKARNARAGKKPLQANSNTEDEDYAASASDSDASEGDDVSALESSADSTNEDNATESEDSERSNRKRKRTNGNISTPRKAQRTDEIAPTPHSKAAIRKRSKLKAQSKRFKIRPMTALPSASSSKLPDDPRERALHVLHVGARPDALPCRDEEYADVLGAVLGMLEDQSGGCLYISGVPGTGKTATVYAAVNELRAMAARNETNPFTYVEINGLKLPDAPTAYRVLWEVISDHDVVNDGHLSISNKAALKQLTKHFSRKAAIGPGQHTCIVLMDELDQLMTAKQDVVYNFFNWPTMTAGGRRLIVIAVANTHDLPERAMSGRVRSRLGMTRINFKPYTSDQLQQIVEKRLESASANEYNIPVFIDSDAIKFASKKVASISGDARRVLDICRRAVETVPILGEGGGPPKAAKVPDVKKVIDAMQNSPTAAYLRDCSLHERIMLAALLKCTRKTGLDHIRWAEVAHQHSLYMNILPSGADSTHKPSLPELSMVLESLLSSRAVIIEEGTLAARKGDSERKVMLLIEQNEVERVLAEIGGDRWKNALGMG